MMRQGDGRQPMVVAGVMSGTSADGIDVAVCRIAEGADALPAWELVGHRAYPYAPEVRAAVLRAMDARSIAVAELARLSWRLGALYADAVEQTALALGVRVELVGCHGQTLYHQAGAEPYLGAPVRATWQTGEAAVLAQQLRCPVVSDFRPADLAAGGQGAPLVPLFDWVMLRSQKVHRVLLNLGGIANLTAIPRGAAMTDVLAWDTGPANMVIDACMERLLGRPYDADGEVAARARVLPEVVETVMRATYFAASPPKSCGREEFGQAFTDRFIAACRSAGGGDEDAVATATALTAQSIAEAYQHFVAPHFPAGNGSAAAVEMVVSGGGAKNRTLLRMLTEALGREGVRVCDVDSLGVPAEAKEAGAFALLAWMTWAGLPGNVPRATGASQPVVLGKVSLG